MFIVKVPEDLIEGFPLFIGRRHRDLASLKTALRNKNVREIYDIGHKMKGTGSVYGFNEITIIGGLLEKYSDEENHEELTKTINHLEYAINNYTKEVVP